MWRVIWLFLGFTTATVSWGDGAPWWNDAWKCRVTVKIAAAKETERDFPVQVSLDFWKLQNGAPFDPSTIRVVECDPATGTAGKVAPCVYLPSESSRGTPASTSWPPPYPTEAVPQAQASSESPQNPARNVADKWVIFQPTTWEPSTPDPPWIISLDFGKPTWINSLWSHYPGHGSSQHLPYRAEFEVATQSEDGLTKGTWEKVGDWKADNGFIFGQYRVVWFTPRRVQCARLVIHQSSGVPWIDDFRALSPVNDPQANAVGTVNWIAEGETTTDKQRVFMVYFGGDAKQQPAATAPTRMGIIREAETSAYSIHGIGIPSQVLTDADASGEKQKNILSCPKWEQPHAALVAGLPVTIPSSGKWSLHLRVRGNLKEHRINVLLDNHPFFAGTFSTEGPEWTILSLPPSEVSAGVHYLEMYLFDSQNQPMEMDYAMLTNDEKFLPRSYLRCEVGEVEMKP